MSVLGRFCAYPAGALDRYGRLEKGGAFPGREGVKFHGSADALKDSKVKALYLSSDEKQ